MAGGKLLLLWLAAGLVIALTVSLILKQPSHFPVTVLIQSWPPTFWLHHVRALALQDKNTAQRSTAPSEL